jgi:hypothetical protein
MANYGNAIYGISKYGATPRLAYSVEPMSLIVTDFAESYVGWQVPTGSFSRVRLVRNQNSFPETAEDGVIVYDAFTTALAKTTFNDGGGTEDTAGIALTSGRPIYYRMFLFNSSNYWVTAGSVAGIVPSNHKTTKKLVDYIPRVFTSAEQSPLAEPDTTSVLYNMLDAYGFQLEESITYLDLLLPDYGLISTPSSMLVLEEAQYGLTGESGLPVKNRKQLVREAIYNYTHKGTYNGLLTYVKALTGYSPTITVSNNLILAPQESTFYQSTGNWIADSSATISSSTDQVPPTNANNIDLTYSCKIVATGAGSMTLGADSPILKGMPVTANTDYVFSAYVKSPLSAGTITPSLLFYDKDANLTTTNTGTATAATNTWAQVSRTGHTKKQVAVGVSSAVGASGTVTYTTSDIHYLQAGDVVTITGFSNSDTSFNLTSVTVASVPTTTTLTVSSAVTGTSSTSGYLTNGLQDSDYASLKLAWSAAGTYYVDMVCLQPGTTPVYDSARTVDIFLNPDKTNYINNPSFESSATTGWTTTGSPTITQDVNIPTTTYSGSKSAKIVATGAWTYTSNAVPVTTGNYYSSSAYVQSSAALTMTLVARDGTGTVIGSYTNPTTPSVTSASFVRQYVTKLIGTNTGIATVEVKFSGGAGTYYLDSVQFEKSPKPTDYIDGNLSSISGNPFGAIWQGTANNSYSSTYNSKPLKVPRLAYTLKDYLPQNCFWRIRTYVGLEYTNLTAV